MVQDSASKEEGREPLNFRPAFSGRQTLAGKGFIAISRGLEDHLEKFPAPALKLYLKLHLIAFWRGPHRGTALASYRQLAEELGMSLGAVAKAARWLTPRYLSIVRASNQAKTTVWKIHRYKGTGRDFAVHPGEQHVNSAVQPDERRRSQNGTAREQRVNSEAGFVKQTKDLKPPNQIEAVETVRRSKRTEERAAENHLEPWERAAKHSKETWEREHHHEPTWSPLEYGRIQQFFADHQGMNLDYWSKTWDHYLSSTQDFGREGHTMKHFVSSFDKYVDGPRQGTNGADKKHTGPTRAQRADAAFAEGLKRLGVVDGADRLDADLRPALPQGQR